ncbi:hypothetical protein FOMPIDRAFT_93733 [Fomitopsis schrenkii]|uniref:Uncharacterized protein n=1 Tax=Fomitopsis schrenkii TaxID=2126942 RepID=S8DP40_FOMSC|nr:hypothetical protein FOMPIDRAFT_93733 [Fomitopsis schrenkii]
MSDPRSPSPASADRLHTARTHAVRILLDLADQASLALARIYGSNRTMEMRPTVDALLSTPGSIKGLARLLRAAQVAVVTETLNRTAAVRQGYPVPDPDPRIDEGIRWWMSVARYLVEHPATPPAAASLLRVLVEEGSVRSTLVLGAAQGRWARAPIPIHPLFHRPLSSRVLSVGGLAPLPALDLVPPPAPAPPAPAADDDVRMRSPSPVADAPSAAASPPYRVQTPVLPLAGSSPIYDGSTSPIRGGSPSPSIPDVELEYPDSSSPSPTTPRPVPAAVPLFLPGTPSPQAPAASVPPLQTTPSSWASSPRRPSSPEPGLAVPRVVRSPGGGTRITLPPGYRPALPPLSLRSTAPPSSPIRAPAPAATRSFGARGLSAPSAAPAYTQSLPPLLAAVPASGETRQCDPTPPLPTVQGSKKRAGRGHYLYEAVQACGVCAKLGQSQRCRVDGDPAHSCAYCVVRKQRCSLVGTQYLLRYVGAHHDVPPAAAARVPLAPPPIHRLVPGPLPLPSDLRKAYRPHGPAPAAPAAAPPAAGPSQPRAPSTLTGPTLRERTTGLAASSRLAAEAVRTLRLPPPCRTRKGKSRKTVVGKGKGRADPDPDFENTEDEEDEIDEPESEDE